MFAKVRDKMRAKVRALDYVMTIHAEEEMENDRLSILDVEEIILTGEIIERQQELETQEYKYLVVGTTMDAVRANVVAKLSVTERLVIITVYLEDDEYAN